MRSQDNLDVEVTVEAETALPPSVTIDKLASLARYVLTVEDMTGVWQFGIRFVDDPTMQQAHADFMGIDTPTDIMTFPYEDDAFDLVPEVDEVLPELGGDLMISVDRAAEHALDAGWGTADELFFVVIHGILHILGWDDLTDGDRSRMLDRQHVLLRGWSGAE